MSDRFGEVSDRLRCLFGTHKWIADRAEDREPDGYQRLFPNDEGRDPVSIDACYLIEKCRRCGKERRIYSSVDLAERHGVPMEWERCVGTDTDYNGGKGNGE